MAHTEPKETEQPSYFAKFDRAFVRALGFFTDDLATNTTGEDIWVLGVRHSNRIKAQSLMLRRRNTEDTVASNASSSPSAAPPATPKRILLTARNSVKRKRRSKAGDQGLDADVSPISSGSEAGAGGAEPDAEEAAEINGWPASFYHDFYSRIALTYRKDFPPIPNTSPPQGLLNSLSARFHGVYGREYKAGGLTTDTGWGCMLRTGQSLLANALVGCYLGRAWNRTPSDIKNRATYARIVSLFIDDPSPLAPFSVHRFALAGKELGKDVGEWFGPSTAAGAIKRLVDAYDPVQMGVVNAVDGTVYESAVAQAAMGPDGPWTRPVLVLLNLRLGLDAVNPLYYESIRATFEWPQSVGIAGGRPCSSYYFVGTQGDALFYLDPHHTAPAVRLSEALEASTSEEKEDDSWAGESGLSQMGGVASATDEASLPPGSPSRSLGPTTPIGPSVPLGVRDPSVDRLYASAYTDDELRTYHCDRLRRMPLSSMDPSMLFGFLVRDAADWQHFREQVAGLSRAVFGIADAPPAWMRGPTAEGETSVAESASFSEPDDWELESGASQAEDGASLAGDVGGVHTLRGEVRADGVDGAGGTDTLHGGPDVAGVEGTTSEYPRAVPRWAAMGSKEADLLDGSTDTDPVPGSRDTRLHEEWANRGTYEGGTGGASQGYAENSSARNSPAKSHLNVQSTRCLNQRASLHTTSPGRKRTEPYADSADQHNGTVAAIFKGMPYSGQNRNSVDVGQTRNGSAADAGKRQSTHGIIAPRARAAGSPTGGVVTPPLNTVPRAPFLGTGSRQNSAERYSPVHSNDRHSRPPSPYPAHVERAPSRSSMITVADPRLPSVLRSRPHTPEGIVHSTHLHTPEVVVDSRDALCPLEVSPSQAVAHSTVLGLSHAATQSPIAAPFPISHPPTTSDTDSQFEDARCSQDSFGDDEDGEILVRPADHVLVEESDIGGLFDESMDEIDSEPRRMAHRSTSSQSSLSFYHTPPPSQQSQSFYSTSFDSQVFVHSRSQDDLLTESELIQHVTPNARPFATLPLAQNRSLSQSSSAEPSASALSRSVKEDGWEGIDSNMMKLKV